MKHLPTLGSVATILGALLFTHAAWASGDALNLPGNLPEFLLYSAQGYLGVVLGNVDNDRANALHLKDAHAAEVVMVDHDAPAGKTGLEVHDVILQLDGQGFDNVDQLRRRLKKIPSGRTINLLISRDGAHINVSVQLCDRALLQQQAWSQHFSVPAPPAAGGGRGELPGKCCVGWSRFPRQHDPQGAVCGCGCQPGADTVG